MAHPPAPLDTDQLRRLLLGQVTEDELNRLAEVLADDDRLAAVAETVVSKDDTLLEMLRGRQPLADAASEQLAQRVLSKLKAARPAGLSIAGETAAFEGSAPSVAGANDGSSSSQHVVDLKHLEHFRIIKKLGEGGMGAVYLAEDTRLNREVAIKTLRPEIAARPGARERFLREARLAASIEHDHVVAIHHVGEDAGVTYLAMPLLRGMSLHERLNKPGRLTIPQVLRLGRQIAEGLSAAHQRGMIHRDIKPSNIWLEPTGGGRVKILDFGLARQEGDKVNLTSSGAILGTPSYMAPEQARAQKVDHRTDLWALGVILYEMTTGRRPFTGTDVMSVLTSLALDEPLAPVLVNPDMPPALSDLIVRLLQKNPENRPASAREVIDQLARIQGQISTPMATAHETEVNPPDGPDSPEPLSVAGPSRVGSGRLLWITLALGFVLVLAGGFVLHRLAFETKEGTLIVEVDDDADVRFRKGKLEVYGEDGKLKYTLEPSEKNRSLPPGKYLVKITGADGLTLDTPQFTLEKGGNASIRVRMESAEVAGKDDPPPAIPPKPLAVGESPFDRLDPNLIPKEDRFDWQPKELVAILGTHRQRHLGGVDSVAISGDGRWVASGGRTTMVLWDRATMNRVCEMKGNRGVAFSPDSKLLACPVLADAIHIYDVTANLPKLLLRVANSSQVGDVSFDASGVLHGLCSRGLQRWRLNGTRAEELPAIASENQLMKLSIDRDGKTAVLLEYYGQIQPGRPPRAMVWDLGGPQPKLRCVVAPAEMAPTIRAVALSPDGKRLATGDNRGRVCLWDVADEKPREVASFSYDNHHPNNLVFTPDGQALIATIPNRLLLWDVSRPVPTVSSQLSFQTSGTALAVSQDGKTVVVSGDLTYVTMLSLEGSRLAQLFPSRGHQGAVKGLDLSRDGKTLVSSAGSDNVRVWAFDGKTFVEEAEAPGLDGSNAVITPAGDYLAAAYTIYERNHARLTKSMRVGKTLCLSADGKTLVVEDGNSLRIMNMSGSITNERLRMPLPEGRLMFSKLNPDGTTLAASGLGVGHIIWWDLREEKPQMKRLPGELDRPLSLAWTPDGKTLIATGASDLVVWDWNQGQPRERLRREHKLNFSYGLAIAPDGLTFATGSDNGAVTIWDTATATRQREWKLPMGVLSVQFAPDGRHLLLGNLDGTIYVLRLAPPEKKAESD